MIRRTTWNAQSQTKLCTRMQQFVWPFVRAADNTPNANKNRKMQSTHFFGADERTINNRMTETNSDGQLNRNIICPFSLLFSASLLSSISILFFVSFFGCWCRVLACSFCCFKTLIQSDLISTRNPFHSAANETKMWRVFFIMILFFLSLSSICGPRTAIRARCTYFLGLLL